MTIKWAEDFVVIRTDATRKSALAKVKESAAQWVLIRDMFGRRWHIAERTVVLQLLLETFVADERSLIPCIISDNPDVFAGNSIHLSGLHFSGKSESKNGRVTLKMESGRPVSVGIITFKGPRQDAAVKADDGKGPAPMPSGASSATVLPPPTYAEDRQPIRYPSIEPQGPVRPGSGIVLVVDLKRSVDPNTEGELILEAPDLNWEELELQAVLVSPDIDFENGGVCRLKVRRNGDTIPTKISGQVHHGLRHSKLIEVSAVFLLGTRYCGTAVRKLNMVAPVIPASPAQPSPGVRLDHGADRPDLTVIIKSFTSPGTLYWHMSVTPFAGCPPKLDGSILLDPEPGRFTAAWFERLAYLGRGTHSPLLKSFGEILWHYAPDTFRELYWALCSEYPGRALTIQFISNDPHLPWELMVPVRAGDPEQVSLAQRHIVARWISDWTGFMTSSLPDGSIVTIAPEYQSLNRAAPSAQITAQKLEKLFNARRVGGTRTEVLDLLRSPPQFPIALVHFGGHGAFCQGDGNLSTIELEDGELAAAEVACQTVRLGERDRTVVFFNACEVGATSGTLGSVAGFANAFLSRKFGGFVGPLWAIDDEDADRAASSFMQLIIDERRPIAEALQILRNRYGHESTTFHSYFFFGDVTARLGYTRGA